MSPVSLLQVCIRWITTPLRWWGGCEKSLREGKEHLIHSHNLFTAYFTYIRTSAESSPHVTNWWMTSSFCLSRIRHKARHLMKYIQHCTFLRVRIISDTCPSFCLLCLTSHSSIPHALFFSSLSPHSSISQYSMFFSFSTLLFSLFHYFAQALDGGHDDIEAVRLVRDPETLIGKGIGYLLFKDRDSVLK